MQTNTPTKKTILRTKDNRWCELQVELKDGRLSICGAEGSIVSFAQAKRNARLYWEQYFKVLEIDGAMHGLDVHCSREKDILITESCGQIRETLEQWFPEAKPYFDYHLNDMHVGTPAQDAELAKHTWDRTKDSDHYTWACKTLAAAGLLVDRGYRERNRAFPKGYKYSSMWLKRELPPEVTAWFRGLEKLQEVA